MVVKYERGNGIYDLQINSKGLAQWVQETLAVMRSDEQKIPLKLAFERVVAGSWTEVLVSREKRSKFFCLVPTAMTCERGSIV